jgi:hypothetical protein
VIETFDAGLEVVKGVFNTLEIDDEWSEWNDRGFEWWGQNLRQRVWASPGYDDDGIIVYRVYAVTDTVRSIKKPLNEVDVFLGVPNSLSVGSAYVFDPSDRSVRLWTTATVHKDIAEWIARLLSCFAILQTIDATSSAQVLASELDGEVDTSGHPLSGMRAEPDGMFGVMEEVFLPQGRGRSPWNGNPEITSICEMLNRTNCFSMGDEKGLTAEFPFGDDTSMLRIVTDDPHPVLGSGVGLYLHLPMWGSYEDASMIAGALNRAETNSKAMSHLMGSWCATTIGDNSLPAFASFFPATTHQSGLLTNMVFSAVRRGNWVGQFLNPNTSASDVMSIVMKRFGVRADPNG